jgi:hypothetical protein
MIDWPKWRQSNSGGADLCGVVMGNIGCIGISERVCYHIRKESYSTFQELYASQFNLSTLGSM